MATRIKRERELRSLLCSHNGRNDLTALLRQYMNIPSGQLPVGTPMVETIMDYEFEPGSNESKIQTDE